MLLVSPERLNNPGFRDEVLPRLAATCRPAGGRRGALHLRLGPRLPARLPPDPHPARRPARRHPGARHHRDRQRPGHRRRRRAARQGARRGWVDVLVLRGSLDRESLHLGVRPAARRPSSGSPGWPTTSPSSPAPGIVYCLTVAATQEIADYLRARGHARRGVLRPDRARPSGSRSRRTCSPAGSRRWSRPARSAWASTRPLGFVVNLGRAAVAGRLLPAGRPRRPRHRPRPTWCCCRRSRTATSGRYFASLAFPREEQVRQHPRACSRDEGRPLSTAALETYVDLRRTRLETMLKVLDVDGAVRRVRGGWEATGQPWAYDEERYDRVRRGPRARAAGDARLPRHRRLPDALPARPARRPRGRPTAAAATTAAALEPRHRGLRRRASTEAERAAGPARAWWSSRARCGRPRWPTSASTSRARSPRRAEEGRAVARLTDLGYGQALRDAVRGRTPRTARCRCRWCRP